MSAAADVSPTVRGTECDTPIEDWLESAPDAWTRKVVARHFHPETGSPYRPPRAARLDFAARDIVRHEQLTAFGPFPVGILRSQDPADLVPLDVPRPLTGRRGRVRNAELMPYVPNYPQVKMNLLRKEDWSTAVEYGTVGQVRPTVPHEDPFLPHILERDQVPRYDTDSRCPSDGGANATPLQTTSSAPDGLY